jgi:hypothetical protein
MTARRSIRPQAPLAVTFAVGGILFAISALAATPMRLDTGGGSTTTEELRSAAADQAPAPEPEPHWAGAFLASIHRRHAQRFVLRAVAWLR